MAIMESSHSISSRESLYSVESEEEEDDHPRGGESEAFLSDSGSDAEKEPVQASGRGFLFSPRSRSGRTHLALLCHKRRRSREPLDTLAATPPRPLTPCCRYPLAAQGEYCERLAEAGRSPLRPAGGPKRSEADSGRKRSSGTLGGGRPFAAQLSSAQGKKKRQRNEETEDREGSRSPCWTEKDHLFAQKCWELQNFVRPLMELLQRLRTGRLNRGLSSFQQSVAMDRIQRIIGVLQKPEMGERYLGTLLQVERMLKVWFPHVTVKDSFVTNTAKNVRDNKGEKRAQGARESPPTEELLQTHLSDSPGPLPHSQRDWPALNVTWIHTSPISNPPLGPAAGGGGGAATTTFGQAFLQPPAPAYGLLLFLPEPSAPSSCCRSDVPLPEPPRCQSLPSAARPRGPGGGTLVGRPSRSLPNLPASSAVSEAPGVPAHRCAS